MTIGIPLALGSTWRSVKLQYIATAIIGACLAIAGVVGIGGWNRKDVVAPVAAAAPVVRIVEPVARSLVVYYLVESTERAARLTETATEARASENIPTSLQNVFVATSETAEDVRTRLDKSSSMTSYEVIDIRAQ